MGWLVAFLPFLILLVDWRVSQSTADDIFKTVQQVPSNKVGMILGTAKYNRSGRVNAFYQFRIDATVQLFKAGKIQYVLVSGDNGTKQYNEPETIKKDLVKRGIPANRIVLDYAGFSTLDSVVRAKAVFGQESITIISQGFHVERAIYLAKRKGVKATGFAAKDVRASRGFKVLIREKFARVKMLLDLFFNSQPKFLGEPIQIG